MPPCEGPAVSEVVEVCSLDTGFSAAKVPDESAASADGSDGTLPGRRFEPNPAIEPASGPVEVRVDPAGQCFSFASLDDFYRAASGEDVAVTISSSSNQAGMSGASSDLSLVFALEGEISSPQPQFVLQTPNSTGLAATAALLALAVWRHISRRIEGHHKPA